MAFQGAKAKYRGAPKGLCQAKARSCCGACGRRGHWHRDPEGCFQGKGWCYVRVRALKFCGRELSDPAGVYSGDEGHLLAPRPWPAIRGLNLTTRWPTTWASHGRLWKRRTTFNLEPPELTPQSSPFDAGLPSTWSGSWRSSVPGAFAFQSPRFIKTRGTVRSCSSEGRTSSIASSRFGGSGQRNWTSRSPGLPISWRTSASDRGLSVRRCVGACWSIHGCAFGFEFMSPWSFVLQQERSSWSSHVGG